MSERETQKAQDSVVEEQSRAAAAPHRFERAYAASEAMYEEDLDTFEAGMPPPPAAAPAPMAGGAPPPLQEAMAMEAPALAAPMRRRAMATALVSTRILTATYLKPG